MISGHNERGIPRDVIDLSENTGKMCYFSLSWLLPPHVRWVVVKSLQTKPSVTINDFSLKKLIKESIEGQFIDIVLLYQGKFCNNMLKFNILSGTIKIGRINTAVLLQIGILEKTKMLKQLREGAKKSYSQVTWILLKVLEI